MSKSKKTTAAGHEGKGFLALAGEAFSVLGEEIVEGKDKIVEVAGDKIDAIKTVISHIRHKKKAPARAAKKKTAPKAIVKKAAKKLVKKAAGAKKVVKKAAKKAVSTPRKAIKKVAKKAAKKAAPRKKKK